MPGRQSASVRSALSVKVVAAAVFLVPVTDAASPLGCSGVPVPVPNTRYFASPRPMRVAIRAAERLDIYAAVLEQFIGYANDFRGQFLAPTLHRRKTRLLHWFQCFRPAVHLLQWYRQRLPSQCPAVGGIQNLRHTGNSTVIFQCFDDLIAELGWYGVPLFHPASCPEHAAPLKLGVLQRSSHQDHGAKTH